MIGRSILACAAALLLSATAEAAEIGRIRAHLVYEETGRLSADVLSQPDFAGWNTLIGEGSAEEPANDVLLLIEVVGSSGGEQTIGERLEVSVRGENGRVLARRSIDGLFASEGGRVWRAVWLPESTCGGGMDIEARIGSSRRRARLELNCGE